MIIGHESIIAYLESIIKKDNPVHAHLFYGPAHVGKTTTAKWFAQALICKSSDSKPCNKCQNCLFIKKNIHPDLHFIKPLGGNRDITIAQIRNLQSKISKTSFYNTYKLIIIKLAENLNPESGNAFLKILEEPPKKTIFILISNNLHNILPTILSRTALIKFNLVAPQIIKKNLSVDFTENQKEFISHLVQGKIGEALQLDGNSITEIIDQEKNILTIIKSKPHQKINLLMENFKDQSALHVKQTISLLRDILLCKLNLRSKITHRYLGGELEKIANRVSFNTISESLESLLYLPLNFRKNINQQLLWQNIFLKM